MIKKSVLTVLTIIFIQFPSMAQSPCIDGLSDGKYPCNQIAMLSHMPPAEIGAVLHNGSFLNDIWGWTDPSNSREYAIIGLKDGVSFVDVTEPTIPIYLGKLQEPSSANSRILHGKSTWRDIKVYSNHAFIVSDINGDHGMQVFDLTKLRGLDGSTTTSFEQDFHYTEVGSAHNIVINEATGYAYIVGTSRSGPCSGGLHIVDIRDPKKPKYVDCFSEDGYTHDAQCVIYNGSDTKYQGMEICFNANEDTFTIVNVDNKSDLDMISRETYQNARYAHQGWLTEDHRYFLMNDELDELNGGILHPRTLIWDVNDLENPILIGEYHNVEKGVDHNLYTHNGLVFESNYQTGLRVLDASNVANAKLRERAYFDTYPISNAIDYGGSWSNFPYFESGTILVSDMENGLFLLKLDLEEDPIIKHPENQSICNDGEMNFSVSVFNHENKSFQWQEFDGSRYSDLENSDLFSGVNDTLLIASANRENSTLKFRCKVTDSESNIFYSFMAKFEGNVPLTQFAYEFGIEPNQIQFKNESIGASTYLWDFGDNKTSIEENPVVTFESDQDLEVTLIGYADCGFSEISQSIVFNVLHLNSEPLVSFFPNPASVNLTVAVFNDSRVRITDLSGKTLLESFVNKEKSVIDISKLENGVFVISVFDLTLQKNTYSSRVIIE